MEVLPALFDNPILTKYMRARLRPGQTLPWCVIVLVLAACAAWGGFYFPWYGHAAAVNTMVGMQAVLLCFMGAGQINSSLGSVRETGLLDFHRVSPLRPWVISLGFFLGAPIREYVLAALILPFAIFSATQVDLVSVWKGLRWLAELEVTVLTSTWLVHAMAMLNCMTRKKPRASGLGAIAMVFSILILSYVVSLGSYLGSRWLLDEARLLGFYGLMLPWLAWILVYELPLLGFLGLAVTRKMEAERTHAFTKPQALACMTTLILLLVGGVWNLAPQLGESSPIEPVPTDIIAIGSVYFLSVCGLVLTITITPDLSGYLKGLRRAAREDHRRLSWRANAASNRIALCALCALVLVGVSTVVRVIGRPTLSDPSEYDWASSKGLIDSKQMLSDQTWLASRQRIVSRPAAVGILTVAYFGLAFQFFSLRTRTSGATLLALLVFLVWFVPLLVGAMLGISGSDRTLPLAIFAISPIPGIAMSTGFGELPGIDTIKLVAIATPITLTFLFAYLGIVTERSLDRKLRSELKLQDGKSKIHPGNQDFAHPEIIT